MTGDTAVETPAVVDNKVEEVIKTDKEVIAEEEKELIENEKTDEPEKTEEKEETKAEKVAEPKKVNVLQKLFGKRKDFVVPKVDEAPKTEGEVEEKRKMLLHLHDDSGDPMLLSLASVIELASGKSGKMLLKY